MKKEELIKKYEDLLKVTINPESFEAWEDIGFDNVPGGYSSVFEWLECNEEFDEGDQIEIRLYKEFIENLKLL